MSKKIDISKLLTKGSAKQRASLLIAHYNILESISIDPKDLKPLLTDREAQAIFNSFKTPKEIKIYNDYRALNMQIIQYSKGLSIKTISFERDWYKYLYNYLRVNKVDKIKDKIQLTKFNILSEGSLIYSYSNMLNFYTALRLYAKESGYTDKHILELLDVIFISTKQFSKNYLAGINGEDVLQELSEIEPEEDEVKNIMFKEFNYNYEKED